jgi:indolepyruvate ferredoxin oxidoreductase beta subunit
MSANFLLVGVGGQGILVAADLVALAGLELGLDVKKSEIHGIAQRGGSVSSQVRWGQRVYSPLILPGEVDYLLAFERLEALRHLELLRPGAIVLCNDYRLAPASVTAGTEVYPTAAQEQEAYAGIRRHYLPALRIAQELGSAQVSNVVLLGALSTFMEVPEQVWQRAIALRVPERLVALNQQAFAVGRAYLALNQESASGQPLVMTAGALSPTPQAVAGTS